MFAGALLNTELSPRQSILKKVQEFSIHSIPLLVSLASGKSKWEANDMDISLSLEVLVKDGRLVLTDRDGKAVSFSPDQSVQRKVSMVTFGELCDVPKLKVAEAFGFKTRKSYYDARNVVLHGASADLLPKRRGPQRPPKRTRDVEILIIGMRCVFRR